MKNYDALKDVNTLKEKVNLIIQALKAEYSAKPSCGREYFKKLEELLLDNIAIVTKEFMSLCYVK